MTLTIPCTLKGRKGRYQVVSKLAEGGMSTVYAGKSSRGQSIVVKEAIGPDLEQAQERLRIEADILRALGSIDRKSTRLNSSHPSISYAVFCLKKKNNHYTPTYT